MARVVPTFSLFTIALLVALALLPAPSALACDERDCYNEVYTASGGHALGSDIPGGPFVCVVEPCGDGGVGLNGARTEAHGEYTYVVASGVDWVFGKGVPLGLCGEDSSGKCVVSADVDCGMNVIWANDKPFVALRYFIPNLAITDDLDICRAAAGTVRATFSGAVA